LLKSKRRSDSLDQFIEALWNNENREKQDRVALSCPLSVISPRSKCDLKASSLEEFFTHCLQEVKNKQKDVGMSHAVLYARAKTKFSESGLARSQGVFQLKLPPNFYQALGVGPDQRFALWVALMENIILETSSGISELDNDQIWLELEGLNPAQDFMIYGNGEDVPEFKLLHVANGVFTRAPFDHPHHIPPSLGGKLIIFTDLNDAKPHRRKKRKT